MKIINGKNAVLGRLASFVAKELLKGEEIAVVNCEEIIITGSKKNIEENFKQKAGRYGTSQNGPIHHKISEKIVKKAIRGMIPNYREGRGREAFKRVKCYNKLPKEFEGKEIIEMEKNTRRKYSFVREFVK